MTRFAFRMTPQVVEMAAQLTGADTTDFPEDLFLLVEMVSPTEFNMHVKTTDEVLEEYKRDSTLEVF